MVSNLIHRCTELHCVRRQPACKPGSVRGGFPPRDDHSSGASVAGGFVRPTRTVGWKQPWARGPAPSLFGLAPGGVYRAAAVAVSAVRSCRTFSPLLAGLLPKRYLFCGTFPRVAPAGRYPAPCFHGARTFLPRALSGLAAAVIRPAGRDEVGGRLPSVNQNRCPALRFTLPPPRRSF